MLHYPQVQLPNLLNRECCLYDITQILQTFVSIYGSTYNEANVKLKYKGGKRSNLMKIIRSILAAVLAIGISAAACGCSVLKGITGGETIRILSGSENEALEQILADCEKSTGVNIEMTYKGSVDIMRELKNGAPDYDAVWTASSLWLSLGDEKHIVKHDESICTTPVIFGIRRSLAE